MIKGNALVCGEGLHETKRCRVVCLDLTPGSEGNLLWSHETASHVECTDTSVHWFPAPEFFALLGDRRRFFGYASYTNASDDRCLQELQERVRITGGR